MTNQFEFFKNQMALGKKYSNWSGDKSLIGIWFGINDIHAEVNSGLDVSEETAESLINIVNDLYSEGGRNFLFINIPSIEKFPMYSDWKLTIEELILNLNSALEKKVMEFHMSHNDANIFIYNAYDEINHIIENKSQYNFSVVDKSPDYGETDVDSYLLRDDNHLSSRAHKILAQDMEDFLLLKEKESLELTHTIRPNSQNQKECFTSHEDVGYPCCSADNTLAYYRDSYGAWGVENGGWCGLIPSKIDPCWAKYISFQCCSTDSCSYAIYEDIAGQWAVENEQWCVITSSNTLCEI